MTPPSEPTAITSPTAPEAEVDLADQEQDEQRRVAGEAEVAQAADHHEEAHDPVVADVVDALADASAQGRDLDVAGVRCGSAAGSLSRHRHTAETRKLTASTSRPPAAETSLGQQATDTRAGDLHGRLGAEQPRERRLLLLARGDLADQRRDRRRGRRRCTRRCRTPRRRGGAA